MRETFTSSTGALMNINQGAECFSVTVLQGYGGRGSIILSKENIEPLIKTLKRYRHDSAAGERRRHQLRCLLILAVSLIGFGLSLYGLTKTDFYGTSRIKIF